MYLLWTYRHMEEPVRDDTLYTISAPDRKSRTERLIALRKERARAKPLERAPSTWRMLAGIGLALVIGGAMCACVLFSALGTIGH